MSCTYRDQLLEARDKIGQEIQEAVGCQNPEYIDKLTKQAENIQKLLEKVVDVDGDDGQDFDVTSIGCV